MRGLPYRCFLSPNDARTSMFSRRVVAKRLAWPRIQASGHRIEILLGVRREVGAVREVLPEESIGVLVRAALPRTLWVAELHADVRGHGEGLVRREFHSAIPREGRHQAMLA